MKKLMVILCAVLLVFGVAQITSAELVEYDWAPGLVYDTDFDITWLKDANYAYTTGYDSDGKMTWDEAVAWAGGLEYESGGVVYDEWRLPSALNQDGSGPDTGYNVIESEMGHLYYTELGNSDGGFQPHSVP